MFFRCDGSLLVEADNTISCSAWVSLTPEQLVDSLPPNSLSLSMEDAVFLLGWATTLYIMAAGIRAIRKRITPRS